MKPDEQSSWIPDRKTDIYPALQGDVVADIGIVGGGLCGVLSAYLLAKAGKSVVLLEQDVIGSGATAYTTAFLTQEIDTDIPELVKMFGEEKTKLIWESGQAAISMIETIALEEKIDCEFKRCSAYIYATKEKDFEDLEEEHKVAQRLGFKTRLSRRNDLNFKNFGYYEIPDQAQYHPLKFLSGVAEKAAVQGVRIYEHTGAQSIEEKGEEVIVTTLHGDIYTKDVIIATYQPFNNPIQLFLKKGMYVSYVLEVEIPDEIIKDGIYWDSDNPYHYFRIESRKGKARMILGGEDHRKEIPMDPEKNFRALEQYLRTILGGKPYTIIRQWTGPILEPSDGLALIGQFRPHQYVAAAFSGNGMTYSAIAAMIFKDLILGKANIWASVYDPRRVPSLYQLAQKAGDYIGELIGGAVKNTFRP